VQKDLVASQLFSSDEDFEKDTLAVLAVHKVDFNNKPGYVYIFKSKPKDKKIWRLGYSGVHPSDTTGINFKPQFTKTDVSFETEAQAKKETEGLLRKIRVEGRKRAGTRDFEMDGTRYDYLYGEY
jgi:hypothetical protein